MGRSKDPRVPNEASSAENSVTWRVDETHEKRELAGVDRLPPNDPRLGSGRCPLDGEDKGQGYCKQAHGDPPAGRLAHPTAIGNDQKPARRS